MLHPNFVIIGSIIGSIGSVAYLIETLKGQVQPNRVSFLVWAVSTLIAFAAQAKQGIGIESLLTFTTGLFLLLIFFATFINKKAEWKVTRFDFMCGVLAVIGLVAWGITKVGNIAILFSIISDLLATIPTLVKAYKYPDSEVAWPWMATIVGVLLTLGTIENYSFANSGYIIYLMLANFVIYSFIQFRIGERLGFKKALAKSR